MHSSDLFEIVEAERERVARELHRHVAQDLALLALQIETSVPDLATRAQLQETCQSAIVSIRELMNDLRRPTFRRGWEFEFERLLAQAGPEEPNVEFAVRGTTEVPEDVALIAYRFLQHFLRFFAEEGEKKGLKVRAGVADKWFRLVVVTDLSAPGEAPLFSEGWAETLQVYGAELRVRQFASTTQVISLRVPVYGKRCTSASTVP